MAQPTETSYTVTDDALERIRAIDGNGHMPLERARTASPEAVRPDRVKGLERDPDHDRWARYWQEMRAESLHHVGDAFDAVAKAFDAGDARAAIDILVFCTDENPGTGNRFGIYAAIAELLLKYNRDLQAVAELRAGCSMDEVIKVVNY